MASVLGREAKGQGKGQRAPPSGPKRTSSTLGLTPRTKLFLGQATPLGLACQKPDGHFEAGDLLAKWKSRVADQKLKGSDDFTATVLCLAMAQMMIDRAVRRIPEAQSTTIEDLYKQPLGDEWADNLRQTWNTSSPLGESWHAKAEEWMKANTPSTGANRHVLKNELELVLVDAFLQKGEIDLDMERARLSALREAQVGCMNFDLLKPASLKDIDWRQTKHASYLQDARVIIVELANHEAVVIGGNTHNAVHSVAAKGILQTMKVKHAPSKVLQPLLHAEWEEMIRSVVGVVDAEAATGVIELLTGKSLSKEDFGLTPTSAWKKEVLFVGELSTACRQPFITNETSTLTQTQLEDIGTLMAADLLFNNCNMLAEQIGLVRSAEGDEEVVTSMVQVVNAEPDGLKRNAYMGQLGEVLEELFAENKSEASIGTIRKLFSWGDAQLSDEQMANILVGMKIGLKSIAEKTWTKESVTKLINKTFRTVKEDIGLSSLEEIMDFLLVVQEEIEEVVHGRTTILGMCGVKSVVSIAVDF